MSKQKQLIQEISKLLANLERSIYPMNLLVIRLGQLSGKRNAPPSDTVEFVKKAKGLKIGLKMANDQVARIRKIQEQLQRIVDSATFKSRYKKASDAIHDSARQLIDIGMSLDVIADVFKAAKPPVPVLPVH